MYDDSPQCTMIRRRWCVNYKRRWFSHADSSINLALFYRCLIDTIWKKRRLPRCVSSQTLYQWFFRMWGTLEWCGKTLHSASLARDLIPFSIPWQTVEIRGLKKTSSCSHRMSLVSCVSWRNSSDVFRDSCSNSCSAESCSNVMSLALMSLDVTWHVAHVTQVTIRS